MTTINEAIGGLLQHAITNWKSTAQSILTLMLVTVPVLLGAGVFHGKAVLWLTIAPALAKVYLGMLQSDGITVQVPPASTVTQTTKIVTPPPGA